MVIRYHRLYQITEKQERYEKLSVLKEEIISKELNEEEITQIKFQKFLIV